MINLRKLAEQEKKQRALKIKNRILKQSHDKKLAENLSPITKKLDTINDITKQIVEVIKESNSENENNQNIVPVEIKSQDIQSNLRAFPNSSIFSDSLTKTLGSLMSSSYCLGIKASPSGPTILGLLIFTPDGDKLRKRDNH